MLVSIEAGDTSGSVYRREACRGSASSFRVSDLAMLVLLILTLVSPISPMSTDHSSGNVVCSWSNITIVRNQVSRSSSEEGEGGRPTILAMPAGQIHSGRLLAILGPSGSGKSSLLSVLARTFHNSSLLSCSSDVRHERDMVTGREIDQSDIAFVHQDDAFFSMLTVKETLELAKSLKRTNEEVVTSDMGAVLANLNLQGVSGSLVGDVDSRGISGGERKRLSLALQLLGSPRYLIADEPTSGLDSFQATQVVHLLRDIAKEKDISSVVSIHQPSSSIWALFDDVILLSPFGELVYQGARAEALSHFEKLGYVCPSQYNPAEFLIDLVSVDASTPERKGEANERIAHMVSAFQEKLNSMTNFHSARKKDSMIQESSEEIPPPPPVNSHDFPAWWTAVGQFQSPYRSESFYSGNRRFRPFQATLRRVKRFGLLFGRASRQVLRDVVTNSARVGISSVLALVVGSVYGAKKTDAPLPVSNKINIIAQAAINVAMLSMIKTLQLLKKERTVVARERTQGQYTAVEYLLSKSLVELPVDALVAAVFGQVLHAHSELKGSRNVFTGVLCLLGCACSSLGLAMGALFPKGDVALALGPALMIVYVIVGAIGPAGLRGTLPKGLEIFRTFSPIKSSCEALCISELSDLGDARPTACTRPLQLLGTMLRRVFRKAGSYIHDAQKPNPVLEELGIDSSVTIRSSVVRLGKMILIHSAVALVGLIINSRSE